MSDLTSETKGFRKISRFNPVWAEYSYLCKNITTDLYLRWVHAGAFTDTRWRVMPLSEMTCGFIAQPNAVHPIDDSRLVRVGAIEW